MTYQYNRTTNVNIIKTGENRFFMNYVRKTVQIASWDGLTYEEAEIAAVRFGFECGRSFYKEFGYPES